MSVVIVAPQTKQPARAQASAPSADSANSTGAAPPGADFASLLLGQLAAGKDLQLVTPTDTPAQTDGNNSSASADPAPQDPALLLAALGMIPQGQAPKTIDVQPPAKTENTLLPGISEKDAAALLNKTPANGLPTDPEAESSGASSGFTLPAAADMEDKPAKLAVADLSLPKAEALPVISPTDPAQGNGAAGISAHTPMTALHNEMPLKVETPVHNHAWADDFNQKIVWLATNDKQVAQLTLNPPQMGPIEISLNLNKDGASALFVSQNAEVREALEAALPRLREMLAGAGIELGQANVSAESFRQQAGNEDARQGTPRWAADNAILGGDSAHGLSGQAIIAQRGNGLVNTFA